MRDIDIHILSESIKGFPLLKKLTLKVVGASPKDYMNLLVEHEFKHLKYLKLIITEQTCLTELINLAKTRYVKNFNIEVNKFSYITLLHFFSLVINPKSYVEKVPILQILENELEVKIEKKTNKRRNVMRFSVVVNESQCKLDIKVDCSNTKTISFSYWN